AASFNDHPASSTPIPPGSFRFWKVLLHRARSEGQQQPGTANSALFMTLEDETAQVDVILWPGLLVEFGKEGSTPRSSPSMASISALFLPRNKVQTCGVTVSRNCGVRVSAHGGLTRSAAADPLQTIRESCRTAEFKCRLDKRLC
ncbi:hypothetical protein, partial [Burkholderia territorii]|uniref:hypothetical protein n=1 Tax=Burkholderia territorii TaxID=1503055 RepID=UPI001E61E3EE